MANTKKDKIKISPEISGINDVEENKTKNKKKFILSESSDNSSECNVDLEKDAKGLNCTDTNYFSNDCNKFQLKKEVAERNCLSSNEGHDEFLYPNLNDTNFNIKIAEKKEFNDTKYDGVIYEDIKKQADILSNADFELQPHQAFVKNFMSSKHLIIVFFFFMV